MTPAARKARTSLFTSRAAFGVGVVVSLAANVMASAHTPLGIAVGLWTPIAFLISMALLENVPVKGRWGLARKVAIGFIALIAGWTSYWHLVDVCLMGGADVLTAHMLPLTVDVMMALASPGMKRKAAPVARRRPAAKNVTSITKARKTATA
jgi:hypothetical protein